MTCGRDAADKGGGNRQDGCGKVFDWAQAAPYARDGSDAARLPKTLADVDPDAAREVDPQKGNSRAHVSFFKAERIQRFSV